MYLQKAKVGRYLRSSFPQKSSGKGLWGKGILERHRKVVPKEPALVRKDSGQGLLGSPSGPARIFVALSAVLSERSLIFLRSVLNKIRIQSKQQLDSELSSQCAFKQAE